MRTRQSLQSGGMQMLLQTYLNPGFVAQLNQQGKTVDMDNVDRLMCDGLNLPQQSLTRALTPQEMQMLQQEHQQEMQMKLQMQQDRLDSHTQNQDAADETKLLIATLKEVLTPDIIHHVVGMKYPAQIAAEAKPKQLTGGK